MISSRHHLGSDELKLLARLIPDASDALLQEAAVVEAQEVRHGKQMKWVIIGVIAFHLAVFGPILYAISSR